ncbi:hypothetical protein R3P38DRAFT_3216045 [Favolaschia claudopus]|uniref:Uncharacterized protein n=1 Tax=Favolaschia claudopus TaxID=2862362 RepID=A0AAW0A749_9AGAR
MTSTARQLRSTLSSFTAVELLQTALQSATLYEAVLAHLNLCAERRERRELTKAEESEADDLATDLPLRERMALHSSDSPLFRRSLKMAAAGLLGIFGLDFEMVQLLLLAVSVVITGSAVTSLVHGGPDFLPNDLDFFAALGEGYIVVEWMRLAGYTVDREARCYGTTNRIRIIWWMTKPSSALKINIIECTSHNPLDAITTFHSTAVMNAWTGTGIWIAYPALTLSNVTMTSPFLLPLENVGLREHQTAWKVLHKYGSRGFQFQFGEYNVPHICGQDYSCPATLRNTHDAGCLFLPFPKGRLEVCYRPSHITRWSLRGAGCAANSPSLPWVGEIVNATSEEDFHWVKKMKSYAQSDVMPDDVFEL